MFDTRLVIETIPPAPASPYPNIAYVLYVGGVLVILIPPVNVIPPVKSIICYPLMYLAENKKGS